MRRQNDYNLAEKHFLKLFLNERPEGTGWYLFQAHLRIGKYLENYAYDSTSYLVLVLGFAAQGIQQRLLATCRIKHHRF